MKAIALMPEGTLSFGRSVLGELGVKSDDIETIISTLRADDYASLRSGGATVSRDAPKEAAAAKGQP